MRSSTLSFTLVVCLASAALVAACGGGTPSPEVPTSASATPPSTSAPTATTPTVAETPPPPKDTTPPPKDTNTPPPKDNAPTGKTMPEVMGTTLIDGLKGIGLDAAKLPKMAQLTGAQRSKVMPLLVQSTGFQCNDCHVQGNFKAETPRKQVARKMWDEFVVPNKLATGPVFCDSCHKGTHDFLDRAHKDAVSAYMDAQYTKKMSSRSGKDVACTTCHGGDMEMKIFEKIWKVKDLPHAEIDVPKPAIASN